MSLRTAAWALTVISVVAACSEGTAPSSPSQPRLPSFSYSANGTALNQANGSLREQNGTMLIKGFNPTNPHHGDAIVATFYWVGSTDTNIIDSVYDVLTDAQFTRVGNTYTLVDFVHAGGYSMATYVATNVQNFPDPNDPNTGVVLAVKAHLTQTVTDGGLTITSWTGVDDNFPTALVDHAFASGSDTTITTAHSRAIAVDSGAMVYTVTMAGLAGLDRPAGYTSVLGAGADDFFKQDVAFNRQATAGTIDPQWTWYFGPQQNTWLVTTLALRAASPSSPPPPPPPNQPPVANFTSSCSGLNCSFTSTSSDPDGTVASYSWNFGDGATSTAPNPSHLYASPGGTFTVTLRVTDDRGAQSATTSKSVTATAPNQAPTANFTSSCSSLNCSFTNTSSDPDGTVASYSWNFGDGATSTAPNPSHLYASPGGTFTVTLRVTDDRGAQSATTSKTVIVTPPNSAPAVNPGPNETAVTGLLYSLGWSFSDANHNGPWTYRINWGDGSTSTGTATSEGSRSNGHTYVTILPRTFTVTVTVTDAAGASTTRSKSVSVLLL